MHGLRGMHHNPQYYSVAMLNKNVILPYLGRVPAILIGRLAVDHLSGPLMVAALILGIMIVGCFLWIAKATDDSAVLLCLMGLWVQGFCLYASLDSGPEIVGATAGTRYYFVFNVFQALALLLIYMRTKHLVPKVLLFLLVFSGLTDYALYWRKLQSAPRWDTQVASHPNTILISPNWWIPLRLSSEHANEDLPFNIDDSAK
jgi:hypothetical protein